MRLISEVDEQRVLRDEIDIVRDERAEREEIAEFVECREEAVDCLLSRRGRPALIPPENSGKWIEGGSMGDIDDSGSSRSFPCGGFGIHNRVCSFFQVLRLRPVATNCSNT